MLQPTMQLRWLQTNVHSHPGEICIHGPKCYQVLQQKWEHPDVDDEGFPHLGEWRDIGVERE